jgi:hypothetical protein
LQKSDNQQDPRRGRDRPTVVRELSKDDAPHTDGVIDPLDYIPAAIVAEETFWLDFDADINSHYKRSLKNLRRHKDT